MSEKETTGPVKLKFVGPGRLSSVPGVEGQVVPDQVIELRDEVLVHGLPHWPEWWERVTADAPAETEEE